MSPVALAISYFYECLGLPAHAWHLYKLRQKRKELAYAYLQETLSDLEVVRQTYKELKGAESQLFNSELTLGMTRRAHLVAMKAAISRIGQRAREETPNAPTAA